MTPMFSVNLDECRFYTPDYVHKMAVIVTWITRDIYDMHVYIDMDDFTKMWKNPDHLQNLKYIN